MPKQKNITSENTTLSFYCVIENAEEVNKEIKRLGIKGKKKTAFVRAHAKVGFKQFTPEELKKLPY